MVRGDDEVLSLRCWLFVCTMLYPILSLLFYKRHLRLYLQHPFWRISFSHNLSPSKIENHSFLGKTNEQNKPTITTMVFHFGPILCRPSPGDAHVSAVSAASAASASAQVWVAPFRCTKCSRGNFGKLWGGHFSLVCLFYFVDVHLQLSDQIVRGYNCIKMC